MRFAAIGTLAVVLAGSARALPAPTPAKPPRAEIQINLCAPPEEVARALELTPAPNPVRQVWYFESPALDHHARGTVFRLRVGTGERTLTLKAPAGSCEGVDPWLLPTGQGKCESDVHGEAIKNVVSLETELDEKTVRQLLDGSVSLASVLSKAQIRYLQTIPGAWPLAADLRPLGPIRVETSRPATGRFVAETWRLPDGQHFVEVSRKADRTDVARVREELLAELAKAGAPLCSDQSSQAAAKLRILLAAGSHSCSVTEVLMTRCGASPRPWPWLPWV